MRIGTRQVNGMKKQTSQKMDDRYGRMQASYQRGYKMHTLNLGIY